MPAWWPMVSLLITSSAAIMAVGAALCARVCRRNADLWRERAVIAESTLDRVLGRERRPRV
jgi:hypothetical protein